MKILFLISFVSSCFCLDYFTADDQFYFEKSAYSFQNEIKLGQARVGEVNGNYWDVKVPVNRKSWALSIAHGHQLMRNIIKSENYPIDIFLATALKESDLGCDHDIIQEEGVEFPLGKQWDAGDGFYQIEGWSASAYGEMAKLYPKRFPAGLDNHSVLIGNEHFETATIGKVYYDLMVFHYWKYVNGYRPLELFDQSTDKGAIVKMLSAAFYMGHQTSGNFYKDVFVSNRNNSYIQNDFLELFKVSPYKDDHFYSMAEDHAKLVYQCVSLFQDSADLVGNPENNFFYDYYDSTITWDDFKEYMEKIKPLYPEVEWSDVELSVQDRFNAVKGGNSLSFRYEIAPVIDELILSLPVENPVPALKNEYSYAIQWHDSLEYDPEFKNSVDVKAETITNHNIVISSVSKGVRIELPYHNRGSVELLSLQGRMIRKVDIANQGVSFLSTKGVHCGIFVVKISTKSFVESKMILIR